MIEVQNLTKRYGAHCAVQDISFQVDEGEILGFLGPNGAGKSTTMNILTGYLSASEGVVKINGFDVLEQPNEAKANIGYLPEQPPLYLDMTVREYLEFMYNLKKCTLPRQQHMAEICRLVKIEDVYGRLIKNLSKGYRQRVGLAQALVGDPDVLILDEPTAGLDPAGRESILENIRAYQAAQHAAVVMVSHSMEEIASNVDRLIVMEKGTAVMNGAPSEVFSHAAELVAMGLNVPCMTQVLLQLQQLGVDVPASAYTVEQAADLLAPLLKGGRPTC